MTKPGPKSKVGLHKYVYDPDTVGFIGRPVPKWKKSPRVGTPRAKAERKFREKYYHRSLRKALEGEEVE